MGYNPRSKYFLSYVTTPINVDQLEHKLRNPPPLTYIISYL